MLVSYGFPLWVAVRLWGDNFKVGGPKDPQIPNCQKLLGSFRAPFWMCFMSLFQPVISSEHCMSLGGHLGTLFTATCSADVPLRPLKPIG